MVAHGKKGHFNKKEAKKEEEEENQRIEGLRL